MEYFAGNCVILLLLLTSSHCQIFATVQAFETARGTVLLGAQYCWRHGIAGGTVLLAAQYCWRHSIAGGTVLLGVQYCSVCENWGCMETAYFRPIPAFDADGTNDRKILKEKNLRKL
jgi:hypothetical protein